MQRALLILVVIASLSSCLAFVPGFGSCPDVKPMQNFDPVKYMGKWYEHQRYFAFFEAGGKCNYASYSLAQNGSVTVLNKQISYITGSKSEILGHANIDNQKLPSVLTVTFPSVGVSGPYWVVDTDYETYSVVWSCTKYGIFNAKYAWVLTREAEPKLDAVNSAYNAIEKNGISKTFLMTTTQKGCPDY